MGQETKPVADVGNTHTIRRVSDHGWEKEAKGRVIINTQTTIGRNIVRRRNNDEIENMLTSTREQSQSAAPLSVS